MRDIQNLYFLPFTKKSINFVFAKISETAFFTVISGIIQMPFPCTFFDLESAADK